MADEALRERLKAALWHTVGKIVDDESLEVNIVASPAFIAALTELVWVQLQNVAKDLECFSNHAGRTTITTDDVLLLVRRNEELEVLIRDFIEKENASKARKRKR